MFDRPLKILFVSTEVVPFAKTGGLADVAGSLPKALATMDNDVRVVMPRYRGISGDSYVADFPVDIMGRQETAIIKQSSIEAHLHDKHRTVPVYFVGNYHYFDRERMYVFHDEAERFTFFCKAVLDMLQRINFRPDVIHCNDWQTGLIPLLLKTKLNSDPFFRGIATVFTIHNLLYQGNYPKETLKLWGLGDEYYHPEALEFYGSVSFMKAGLLYADVINTVSKTYAREIQTPELGEGFDGLLRKRSHDLYGILNGINYHEFNPETDPRIYRNYSKDSIENKKENKYALQKEVGLPVRDVPVIGLISRLVDQKGLNIIADTIDRMMEHDIQFTVLGLGDEYYHRMFQRFKNRYPDKIGLYIGFNPILAQRIYAGADMFLMPSKYEPCGLGQIISMRYGTIPIVRSTGGLADTVNNYNPMTKSGNGFTFSEYSGEALYQTITRALSLYHNHPDQWQHLVRSSMGLDLSWARSAVEYMQLYQTVITKVHGQSMSA